MMPAGLAYWTGLATGLSVAIIVFLIAGVVR